MRLVSRFDAKVALAATLCWAVAMALTGSTDALLFLAPALLIVVPLLFGVYVGEDLIVRLAERNRGRRPARPASVPAPRRPLFAPLRGGRLISLSLAKRPPPARLLPQS